MIDCPKIDPDIIDGDHGWIVKLRGCHGNVMKDGLSIPTHQSRTARTGAKKPLYVARSTIPTMRPGRTVTAHSWCRINHYTPGIM